MKKLVIGVVTVALVALLSVGVWLGKNYYDARYVSTTYYARIPEDYDMTLDEIKNMDGEVVGKGKYYYLTGFNEEGSKEVMVKVYKTEPVSYPGPGTYIQIEASRTLTTGWSIIDENEVPENILVAINQN